MRLFVAPIGLLVGSSLAVPFHHGLEHNLNALAQRQGKHWFGTAADIPGTEETTNDAYLNILQTQFGEITPANAMKFMYTEPGLDYFNFTEGDYFMNLAKSTGKAVRCHNLVWASQVSSFVTSTNWTAETLIPVMKNHIFKTVQHFGKRCYSWDVVNEALNSDGTFSSSIWYDTIGEDYFYLAFKYAQEALEEIHASDVKLYYNDYGIENPGTKANAVRNLVKELRKRHIRIDGIGLESHFIVGKTPSLADQTATQKAYIAANLDVVITELDIRFSKAPFYSAAGQKQQALDYSCRIYDDPRGSSMEAGDRIY
ncbi:hypothetical protein P175DRAFT_0506547 [Aspergillus ochraceoroseus IBT 24754]|uniref:Beta-xylanase n=2 Tax=Aspergillus ochraceoroseus TaxID=138278 RepID=A0A2T5M8Z3_9EURO|nr:uncharacterized protein P175DRAFT_0506547 [Aspergillus ochraceoroseus IBT 24754]PTU24985.1 hypothetical protein P175DRAFT_0506547 [Aspergillus ochraceoroseus IBT 24754]